MVEFDKLPPKSRSLILATLGLEIASSNCTSIFDLARRRRQTIDHLWRDICRRTAQPHCTMPRRVLDTRYTADPTPSESAAAASVAPATEPSVAAPEATANARRDAASTAVPSKPAAATPSPDPPIQRWYVVLAIGVSAVLAAGVAVVLVLAFVHSAPTTTVTSGAPLYLGGATPAHA